MLECKPHKNVLIFTLLVSVLLLVLSTWLLVNSLGAVPIKWAMLFGFVPLLMLSAIWLAGRVLNLSHILAVRKNQFVLGNMFSSTHLVLPLEALKSWKEVSVAAPKRKKGRYSELILVIGHRKISLSDTTHSNYEALKSYLQQKMKHRQKLS
jgi:hypothetical protein